MVTGDLCRALLLLLVTRLCRAVLLLMVTGDCAESCWLLENVPADCADHSYGYWRPVQSTPIITGH